jgi:excinuclease UvrABC nuclease subunit
MKSTIAQYEGLLQTLLERPAISFDENLHSMLPSQGGVYRIFEKGSDWQSSVYIGKCKNLQNRIYRNHLMGNRRASTLKGKLIEHGDCADENEVKQYFKDKCLVQFLTVLGDAERTYLEHFAVAILRPRYND